MPLEKSTFDYLRPTDAEIERMGLVRGAVAQCASSLESLVPDGPDKTYLLRKLREVGMWANVAITRYPDGSPRLGGI